MLQVALLILSLLCLCIVLRSREYYPNNFPTCQNACGYILDVDDEDLTDAQLAQYWSCYDDCMKNNYKEPTVSVSLSPCAELAQSFKQSKISLSQFCDSMIWLDCGGATIQMAGNPDCQSYYKSIPEYKPSKSNIPNLDWLGGALSIGSGLSKI